MAKTRTVKPADVRKGELLDLAQQLFYQRGYEGTSVADIIDAARVSKGAFYHHFSSKEQLLDSLIERMVEQVIARLEPMVGDPSLPALDKLHRLFEISRLVKAQNKDLLLSYIRVMYSAENFVMVRKSREQMNRRLGPLMDAIVGQGVGEGVFSVPLNARLGEVILSLAAAMGDLQVEAMLSLIDHPENIEKLIVNVKTYEYALERILGAAPGTIHVADEAFVREMMADIATPTRSQAPG